ncbi:FtsX-like permease family protein [Curvibacter gracilis]|uniref:FtsX-like permease family protein n=1 Tax=Curvibacter gracilis TaxID=230310 RepID=UPI00048356B4|nr:ABC transporter permease [Curvibacter gracilis]
MRLPPRHRSPVWALLCTFSWQELRRHPWRSLAAIMAVLLGVALAFSVHLINASALDEFSQAVRSVNGRADLELRAVRGGFDEALYPRVVQQGGTAEASPVLELNTLLLTAQAPAGVPLRLLGVDALRLAGVAPDLIPRPHAEADRLDMLRPGRVFLNAAAQALAPEATQVQVQTEAGPVSLQVAGTLAVTGPATAVMDIAAAQDLFDRVGQLSRIDVRLQAGVDHASYLAALKLPADVLAHEPADAGQQIDQLSRAYRVNLTVLALVALFTGAFLVFSVLSLSVARRTRQFALLGVLGLPPRERARLVLYESLLLGGLGSVLGLVAGTALAALALRWLGGDLGGGYFTGVAPSLRWRPAAALIYGGLGVAAALAGGWWPARAAAALPPASSLKGLGDAPSTGQGGMAGLVLMAMAGLLALSPPWWGIPVAAYVSVAALLVGGIVLLPSLMAAIDGPVAQALQRHLLPLLAVERARRMRGMASSAISGVVASLSLAVALTVMVSSFRTSVIEWLDRVLPAPLYVHLQGSQQASDVLTLPQDWLKKAAALPSVQSSSRLRVRALQLMPGRPKVTLIAKDQLDDSKGLPLQGQVLETPPGAIGLYVSEAMVDLYQARPGEDFGLLTKAFPHRDADSTAPATRFFVKGIWRDYARQSGTVVMDRADYEALSGDAQVNDLALWPKAGVAESVVEVELRALPSHSGGSGAPLALEVASSAEIRERSLKIFDRSFAVTYWLQAVAIGIGLFGVAASFSAQVLARRKEFGLLTHLGLTRRQILAVVAGEGLVWTCIGAMAGLLLGLAVAVLLVKVVNPQSFHWSMELHAPWARLLALCLATVAAGTVTAWLSGRAAVSRDAVSAVREDW